MKLKFLLLCFLILCFSNTFAQLSGNVRINFHESFLQTCYNTQRSSSINNAIADKTIYQYCKCNAIYIADSMSNEFLKGIERGEQKMNPSLVQIAASYCTKNYKRY
jgi:hypothetical protein